MRHLTLIRFQYVYTGANYTIDKLHTKWKETLTRCYSVMRAELNLTTVNLYNSFLVCNIKIAICKFFNILYTLFMASTQLRSNTRALQLEPDQTDRRAAS